MVSGLGATTQMELYILYNRIADTHDRLTKRLLTNTKEKHIPEQYKKGLADLLTAFDLRKARTVAREEAQADGYTRIDVMTKSSIKMLEIKAMIEKIGNNVKDFQVNDIITEKMERLAGVMEGMETASIDGLTIDQLTVDQLRDVADLLSAIEHEINNYMYVEAAGKRMEIEGIAEAQYQENEGKYSRYGGGKDYVNFMGNLDEIIDMDEVTAPYLFRPIDAHI